MENVRPHISVGVLLPFDYNLYQVAILLDVFTQVNKWSEVESEGPHFDLWMMQTQGQINEYSDTFFHYPVVNTFYEKQFDFVIIPPCNSDDVTEVLEKNKVFKDWIIQQFEGGAHLISLGNGWILTSYAGLLEGKEISLAGFPRSVLKYFELKKSEKQLWIQKEEKLTLSHGSVQIFKCLLSLLQEYFSKEFIIRICKHYQKDLNEPDIRCYQEFEWVYETQDADIDEVLMKMNTQFSELKTIEEIIKDYPESRRNFNRKFLDQVQMTPVEYLQNIRISAAKRLLESSELSIENIAQQVGYEDVKSFRFIFVRITGLHPLDYRKKWRS